MVTIDLTCDLQLKRGFSFHNCLSTQLTVIVIYLLCDNKFIFWAIVYLLARFIEINKSINSKFLIAQYLDDFSSSKTTVPYRQGGNFKPRYHELSFFKKHSSRSFNRMYISFDSCALNFCAYCMIISYSTFHFLSLQTSHQTLLLL